MDVPCTRDDECDAGTVCDNATGDCIPGHDCTTTPGDCDFCGDETIIPPLECGFDEGPAYCDADAGVCRRQKLACEPCAESGECAESGRAGSTHQVRIIAQASFPSAPGRHASQPAGGAPSSRGSDGRLRLHGMIPRPVQSSPGPMVLGDPWRDGATLTARGRCLRAPGPRACPPR